MPNTAFDLRRPGVVSQITSATKTPAADCMDLVRPRSSCPLEEQVLYQESGCGDVLTTSKFPNVKELSLVSASRQFAKL